MALLHIDVEAAFCTVQFAMPEKPARDVPASEDGNGVLPLPRISGGGIEQCEDGSTLVPCRDIAKVEPMSFRSRKQADDATPAEIVQRCWVRKTGVAAVPT